MFIDPLPEYTQKLKALIDWDITKHPICDWHAWLSSMLPRLQQALDNLLERMEECKKFMEGLQWEMVCWHCTDIHVAFHTDLKQNCHYLTLGAAQHCGVQELHIHPALCTCSRFIQSGAFAARDISALQSFTKSFIQQYPVTSAVWEVEFMNMWWLNLDKATFPAADVLISFPILPAVLILTHYSYKVTLQGKEPHWTHWRLLWMVFGRPSARWTTWSTQRRNRWIF